MIAIGKTGAIIQARMGSTRLPGKVMLDLCGRPVIHHVIDRVLESRLLNLVVIATTDLDKDDVLAMAVNNYHPKIVLFRGSEEDVLDRYYQAAKHFGIETVVRITSDCPLIDPEVIDLVIDKYNTGRYDYVSNVGTRTYPRGLDTEVFSRSALEEAWLRASLPGDREHVTPYLRDNPGRFRISEVTSAVDYSDYRWTLDTPEDWRFVQEAYSVLYRDNGVFSWKEVLELLKARPELARINAHVQQKT